ncbi:mechanosensitive ion channel family protein [soil metagenome]
MRQPRSLWLLAILCALLLWSAQAMAFAAAVLGQAERAVAALRQDLTRIQNELALPTLTTQQITDQRVALENVRSTAIERSDALNGPIDEVMQQLTSIGPAPAEGKTESGAITDQRTALTASLNCLQAAKKQLELIVVETDQVVERAAKTLRTLFFSRIFEPSKSILSPILWYEGFVAAGIFIERLSALFSTWWEQVSASANLLVLVLVPFVLALLSIGWRKTRGLFIARFGSVLWARRAPDDTTRLWRVVRGVVVTAMVSGALVLAIYGAFEIGRIITPRFEAVFGAAADLFFFSSVMALMARRVASPGTPEWRVVDLDDRASGQFALLASLTGFVVSLGKFFTELAEALYLPVGFSVANMASSAIVLSVLIAATLVILRNQDGLPKEAHDGTRYFKWARLFTPIVWLLLAIAIAALLLGYIALAEFITRQIVYTSFYVAGLITIHNLSDAMVASGFDPRSAFGQFLRRLTGLSERGVARLGLIFRAVFDFAAVLIGLPLLFFLWAVTWIDFDRVLNLALAGVEIGDVRLSLGSGFIFLVTIAVGYGLTTLFTKWLDSRVLSQTRIDKGVRDSVTKGASYTGYILAAVFALSAAGLDFSNLAIIAGALGVGIGFGLQSIVNNFISGLILLVERPVRAGDWVDVKGGEGFIKQINVRSTEIETFDNCSIIVPNSVLVTEVVKNWTHRDTIGRFMVEIAVATTNDPVKVKDVIMAAAKEHAMVLSHPEPGVSFAKITETSLVFQLFAYVGDILNGGKVASDLRYALLAAFAANGISLPSLVREVHVVNEPAVST